MSDGATKPSYVDLGKAGRFAVDYSSDKEDVYINELDSDEAYDAGYAAGLAHAVRLLQEETAKWPQNKHAQEWLPHAIEVLEREGKAK